MATNSKQAKLDRLLKALRHEEADRVPAGDFFWSGFVTRCTDAWGDGFDPYRRFDLDYIVMNPNMDPMIRPFEIVEQHDEDVVVRTGFGATLRRRGDAPMPYYESFSVTAPDQMAEFELEPADDERRFFAGGDDQINGVGDALARDLPSWSDRVDSYVDDIPVFGSICEVHEYLWRIIGSENTLMWLASDPEPMAAFIDRLGDHLVAMTEAQIRAGAGRLSGMYVWGDVAYVRGMLFGAARWRDLFKPHVKRLIDVCHAHDLPVIYHGCGDAREIFDDMVAMGLDGYNPLEAKAGIDVVQLKDAYAGRLAFVGNIDVRVLETNDPAAIEREVLYKLQAARGGGWVFQSDHSVSSGVAPESYQHAIDVLGEHGSYPLCLP